MTLSVDRQPPSSSQREGFDPLYDYDYDVEDAIHQQLIRDLDQAALRGADPEEARERVRAAAQLVTARLYPRLAGDAKEEVALRVVDEVVGLGPLEPLLRDPTVSEIMVNAPDAVYIERDSILQATGQRFRDDAHIMRIIDRIVASVGRHVDEASPMVDARLHDGSRVNVIIPPLIPSGPVITIRRFLGDRYTWTT